MIGSLYNITCIDGIFVEVDGNDIHGTRWEARETSRDQMNLQIGEVKADMLLTSYMRATTHSPIC